MGCSSNHGHIRRHPPLRAADECVGGEFVSNCCKGMLLETEKPSMLWKRGRVLLLALCCIFLGYFPFEMLCVSNHTVCRFAEKKRFFRSLRAGRGCAAASRSASQRQSALFPAASRQLPRTANHGKYVVEEMRAGDAAVLRVRTGLRQRGQGLDFLQIRGRLRQTVLRRP